MKTNNLGKLGLMLVALSLAAVNSVFSGSAGDKSAEAVKFFEGSYEEAQKAAAESGKMLLVDFKAEWCGPCKMMDRTTWKDSDLAKLMSEKTVSIQIDVDRHGDLASRFRIMSIPTIVLMNAEGEIVQSVIGYQNAEAMKKLINGASS